MNLSKFIDHTILKPNITDADVLKVCQEAKEYDFFSVCVNPYYVPLVAKNLENSDVKVCSVIGFPLGANTTAQKVSEANEAVLNGADEIDMVINISALKDNKDAYVLKDIQMVKEIIGDKLLKVIIETCLLTEEEKVRACELSVKAGADFVKTSTGFSTGGATVEDIQLMRKTVGPDLGVKASGGVRDTETAKAMIAAGATRIGASASINIVTGEDKVKTDY